MPSNRQIADMLNLLGDLMELDAVNKFKTIAVRNAARRIADTNFSVEQATRDGTLTDIPDVGERIAEKIDEFIATGRLKEIDEYLERYPADLVTIQHIQGVGPKTTRKLWLDLGVRSLEDLERAAMDGRVAELPGMGEKSQENILKAIARQKKRSARLLLGDVLPIAEESVEILKSIPEARNVIYGGSVRRMKETVKDLDIIATATRPEALTGRFCRLPMVADVIAQGPTKCSIHTHTGLQIDLRVVPHELFGNLLQHFTGSKDHNVAIRELAISKGLKVSEYGVEETDSGVVHECETEEEVYRLLGLDYIPPELRENNGELAAAAEGKLPRLIEPGDLRGDMHVHSNWSDGDVSIRTMALELKERGYRYMAISDHTQSLGMVEGLNPDRVKQQLEEVAALNEELRDFHIFSSVEMDVRASGELDFGDDILEQLDFVTVSIHSGFRQNKQKIMERLRAAMENPFVRSIGHPTGRLINKRDPYEVDIDGIIEMAAETGTALEINSHYYRLDLSDIHARAAQEAGVKLLINSDAHRPREFDMLRYGIAVARRGWIRKETVLNTLPLAKLKSLLAQPKQAGVGKA
jgi:DNA polymerase (family 10)